MDTTVLRAVGFVGRAICGQRTKSGFSRSQRHESALPATRVIPHAGQEPPAAVPAPPTGMVGDSRATIAGCSVTGSLPSFLWQDATMTPEDAGAARSRRGIMPNFRWVQIALMLGSVGSDFRRV